jgi:hypothetical protein
MQQMAAAYAGQPTYFAYAPTAAGSQQAGTATQPAQQQPQAATTPTSTQQQLYANQQAASAQNLVQQQTLVQQIQQQQQYQQQLAAAGLVNPYQQQQQQSLQAQLASLQAAAGLQVAQQPAATAPTGYQLINYAQPGTISQAALQQLQFDPIAAAAAGLGVRPAATRIVNLRHHPYQRN